MNIPYSHEACWELVQAMAAQIADLERENTRQSRGYIRGSRINQSRPASMPDTSNPTLLGEPKR